LGSSLAGSVYQLFQLFIMLFQQLHPLSQLANCLILGVNSIDYVVHNVVRSIRNAPPILLDDPSRDANNRAIGWNILVYNSIGTNLAVVTNVYWAKNLGSHTYQYAIANGWVPLYLIQACATKGYLMIHQDVVAYNCGFTNYNAHAMVNEKSSANRCTGMYLNACEEARKLRDKPRRHGELALVKRMGNVVQPEGMQARIRQYLEQASCRRVLVENGTYIFTQTAEHACYFSPAWRTEATTARPHRVCGLSHRTRIIAITGYHSLLSH
jgi:hypothetical protein